MNSRRTIGQFSKHLFWDVDRSKLNLENDKPYIIRQVLEYGLLEDWVLLQRHFGIGQIAETAKNFRELDKKTLSFIAFLSQSQKKDFRCYTYQQLTPPALELLSALMHSEKLKHLRLAGGTALALQIGHRKSVDLDLFGDIDFGQIDTNLLFKEFEAVTILKRTENINIFSINGIKVDFVNYSYRWIDDILCIEGIRLARMKDIAAMKLAAITGRGSKKDFVDLYFLLNYFSFNEMLSFYTQKHPDGSAYLLLKSMTYFEDAESEPMPDMLVGLSWQQVKDSLLDTVFEYNRSLL